MKKIIVITGPTATGKSALAVKVAKAISGEVISADSMQIYLGMDVGTAKITEDEKEGIPHHMIDIVHPNTRFTVAEYQKMAVEKIEDILERGKVPIVCGGTGLYINSILFEMNFSNYDTELKAKVKELASTLDKQQLWDYLFSLDSKRAEQLSVNDVKRVTRAIEIAISGTKPEVDETQIERYDAQIYVLNGEREDIYERINSRVDIMLENGLVEEVKRLLDDGIEPDSQAIQGIGYKEITSALQEETTIQEAVDLVKQKSRNYAKRQLTWFRRYYKNAKWLNYKEKEENLSFILNDYYGKI